MNGYTLRIIDPIQHELTIRVPDLVWEAVREDGYRFVRRFVTSLVFAGSDYEQIYSLWQADACRSITVEILRYGTAVDVVKFRLDSDTWNGHSAILSPAQPSEYASVLDNWEESFNVLQVSPKVKVGPITADGYLSDGVTCSGPGPGPEDSCLPDAIGWTLTLHIVNEEENSSGTITSQDFEATYQREELISAVNPGGDWVNVSGNLWARPLTVTGSETTTDFEFSDPGTGITERRYRTIYYAFGFTGQTSLPIIDNGVLLNAIIERFGTRYGFGVRSEILRINDVEVPIPEPYRVRDDYAHIVCFQKTDVTKHDARNNAFRAQMTLKELLELLLTWQFIWWMDDGTLRIEHISYFTDTVGRDARTPRNEGLDGWDYDDVGDVKSYEYKWQDASDIQFDGLPVVYDCGGTKNEELVAGRFTTNYVDMIDDPDGYEKDGFALVATRPYAGDQNYDYEALYGTGLNGELVINYPLTWVALSDRFYRHGALSPTGTINDLSINFATVVPRRVLPPLNLVEPDFWGYNPEQKVQTWLGSATVDKATYSARAQTLTIESKVE